MKGRVPRRVAMSQLALGTCFGAGLLGASACDLSPLRSGDLFVLDAGRPDAAGANDALPPDDGRSREDAAALDAVVADVGPDVDDAGPSADGASDDADGASPDAGRDDAGDAGCGMSCGAGTFCSTLTGRCEVSTGRGMLSGVIRDACDGAAINALVGIAGQHQCSFAGKGAYFFTNLPLGKLELAAAKTGYLPATKVLEIHEGGDVLDVELARQDDPSCTGQRPAATACVCDAGVCTL